LQSAAVHVIQGVQAIPPTEVNQVANETCCACTEVVQFAALNKEKARHVEFVGDICVDVY
jgi:hypothetical protein